MAKKVFYRSPNESVCADVIPFFEDGKFRLFYLRDFRNIEKEGEGCPWCLLETDLKTYVDNGPTLLRGTVEEQDLYVFTGSIFKKDDTYVIYYTGHNPHLRAQGLPEQKIVRAFSKDLKHWEKDKSFVFEAPDYLEMHDFRDPFVYYDEDNKIYRMLIAAREKSELPYFVKGVTLMATSTDFDHWTLDKTPFYAPHAYFTHECPDLFKMGDYWYLIFSEFTDKISTTYRISKSPNGPWTSPMINTFDDHAFYAAKSCLDDKGRRILFGWNCIKNHEVDREFWQWGGTIIPHEIVQKEDGTLGVKCPDEIKDAFNEKVEIKESIKVGNLSMIKNDYVLGDDGTNIVTFKEIPSTCKITMKIKPSDERGDFGIILRGINNLEQHYKIKFDASHNRLAFDKMPRVDSTLHFQADTERYIKITPNEEINVTIIMQESVLEVYCNDFVCMSARMFDIPNGEFGIYTNNTTAIFKDIEVNE